MRFLFLLILLYCSLVSSAQRNFIEGQIVYSVSIDYTSQNEAKQKVTGLLTISLKEHSVLKELSIGSGFRNTMLFKGLSKSAYSLRVIGEEPYALEIDTTQLKQKQLKCSNLSVESLRSDIKTIANFKTEKAILKCNNAMPILMYFTKDWSFHNQQLFEDFPSFAYLPLSFELKNEDGSVMHFELMKIEERPMDNSLFEIPKGYKIISQEEYRAWQH